MTKRAFSFVPYYNLLIARRDRVSLRAISLLLILSLIFEQAAFANPELKPLNFFGTEKLAPRFVLPESVAWIEDSYKAPSAGNVRSKTIYLLQDAHTNASGQLNIAKTLQVIMDAEPVRTVYLEAGSEKESLESLRGESLSSEQERVALGYLRRGELQGVEYQNLFSKRSFEMRGIEDPALYSEALEAYRAAAKGREKFLAYLDRVEAAVKILKPRIYNSHLLRFDAMQIESQKKENALTDSLSLMLEEAARQNVDLGRYPHLLTFSKLKEQESQILFKEADAEQTRAVGLMPENAREELLGLSVEATHAFKISPSGSEGLTGYFARLESLLGKDLHTYPELSKYLAYLKAARQIDLRAVLAEEHELEKALYAALSKTEDERSLSLCASNTRLLRKILLLSVTSDEYAEYQRGKDQAQIASLTGFLNQKIADLGEYYENALFIEPGYEDAIRSTERFYELTHRRDEFFLAQLTDSMAESGETHAVLIAGGYHAAHLKTLLKSGGFSYVSIIPQIYHETNQARYEKLLLNQNLSHALGVGALPGHMMIGRLWDGAWDPLNLREKFTREMKVAEKSADSVERIADRKDGARLAASARIKKAQTADARAVSFYKMNRELISLFAEYGEAKKSGRKNEAAGALESVRAYAPRLDAYIKEIREYDLFDQNILEGLEKRPIEELKPFSEKLAQDIKVYTQRFETAQAARDQKELERLNREVLVLLRQRLKTQLLRLKEEFRAPKIAQGPIFMILGSTIGLYRRISYEHTWADRRLKAGEILERFRMGDATGHLVFNLFYEKEPVIRVEREADGKIKLSQNIWKYVEVPGGPKALKAVMTPIGFEALDKALRSRIHALVSQEEEYTQLIYHDLALQDIQETLRSYLNSSESLPIYLKEQIGHSLESILTGPNGKKGLRRKVAFVKDRKGDAMPMPGPTLAAAQTAVTSGNLKTAAELVGSSREYIDQRLLAIERTKHATVRKRDYVYLLVRDQAVLAALKSLKETLEKRSLKSEDLDAARDILSSVQQTYFRFILREWQYRQSQRMIQSYVNMIDSVKKEIKSGTSEERMRLLPGFTGQVDRAINLLERSIEGRRHGARLAQEDPEDVFKRIRAGLNFFAGETESLIIDLNSAGVRRIQVTHEDSVLEDLEYLEERLREIQEVIRWEEKESAYKIFVDIWQTLKVLEESTDRLGNDLSAVSIEKLFTSWASAAGPVYELRANIFFASYYTHEAFKLATDPTLLKDLNGFLRSKSSMVDIYSTMLNELEEYVFLSGNHEPDRWVRLRRSLAGWLRAMNRFEDGIYEARGYYKKDAFGTMFNDDSELRKAHDYLKAIYGSANRALDERKLGARLAQDVIFEGVSPDMGKVVAGEVVLWYNQKRQKGIDISIVRADDTPEFASKKVDNEITALETVLFSVMSSFSSQMAGQTRSFLDRIEDQAKLLVKTQHVRAEYALEQAVTVLENESMTEISPDLGLYLPQAVGIVKRAIQFLKNREDIFYLSSQDGHERPDDAEVRRHLITLEKRLLMTKIYDVLLNLPYGFNTEDKKLQQGEKDLAAARKSMFDALIPKILAKIEEGKTARHAIQSIHPYINDMLAKMEKNYEKSRAVWLSAPDDSKKQSLKIGMEMSSRMLAEVQAQKGYLLSIEEDLDSYNYLYEPSDLPEEREDKIAQEIKRHKTVMGSTFIYENLPQPLIRLFNAFVLSEIHKGRPIEYATAKAYYHFDGKQKKSSKASESQDRNVRNFLMRYYDIAKWGVAERGSDKHLVVLAEAINNESDFNAILRKTKGHGQVVSIVVPKNGDTEARFPHWYIFAKHGGIIPLIQVDFSAEAGKRAGIRQMSDVPAGTLAAVDGKTGRLLIDPAPSTLERWMGQESQYEFFDSFALGRALKPALIGGRSFELWLDEFSIIHFEDRDSVPSLAQRSGGQGVGLLRMEELVFEKGREGISLDEERLSVAVDEILSQTYLRDGKALTVRVYDVQGDKGETLLKLLRGSALKDSQIHQILKKHSNVRFYLDESPEYHDFREYGKMQLRALFKAHADRSPGSGLRILFPNVLTPEEVDATEKFINEAKSEFIERASTADEAERWTAMVNRIPIGYMIEEVSSVNRREEILSKLKELKAQTGVDRFAAIGTSDLLQSVLKREGKSDFTKLHPQLVQGIAAVAKTAREKGITLTVDGEWANSPLLMYALISIDLFHGLRTIWVPQTTQVPAQLEYIRHTQREDLEKYLKPLIDRIVRGKDLPSTEEFHEAASALHNVVKEKAMGSREFKDFVGRQKTHRHISTDSLGARLAVRATGQDLFESLRSKYGVRYFLRGGPIRPPDFFTVFRPNEALVKNMVEKYGKDRFKDLSFAPLFSSPEDIKDFKSFAREIFSGERALPIVFKPNRNSLGRGIFFLEKDLSGDFVITMAYSKDDTEGRKVSKKAGAVTDYLAKVGVTNITLDEKRHVARFVLEASRENKEGTLFEIWNKVAADFRETTGFYDSGMAESMMPFMRYEGRAYETRHDYEGDLATGEVRLLKEDGPGGGWYARLGSSAYFANTTGRETGADVLKTDKMFGPIYEMLRMGEGSRREFEEHVDDLVRREFIYLRERLKQAGVPLDFGLYGTLDLMWLPPDAESHGYPVPVLTEMAVEPRNILAFGVNFKPVLLSSGARLAEEALPYEKAAEVLAPLVEQARKADYPVMSKKGELRNREVLIVLRYDEKFNPTTYAVLPRRPGEQSEPDSHKSIADRLGVGKDFIRILIFFDQDEPRPLTVHVDMTTKKTKATREEMVKTLRLMNETLKSAYPEQVDKTRVVFDGRRLFKVLELGQIGYESNAASAPLAKAAELLESSTHLPRGRRYKIELSRTGSGSWQAGLFPFTTRSLSSETEKSQQDQAIELYRSFEARLTTEGARSYLFTEAPEAGSETLLLIDSNEQTAGLLHFNSMNKYLNLILVEERHKGIGAADILLEEFVERVLSGDRSQKFTSTIRGPSKDLQEGLFYGTMDDFKQRLGIRSVVRLDGARLAQENITHVMDVDVKPDESYQVVMTRDILDLDNPMLANEIRGRKAFFVVDRGIGKERIAALRRYIQARGITADTKKNILIISGGEKVKTGDRGLNETVYILYKAWKAGMDRKSVFVLMGGGAVLDMSGFATSIFHRGADHIRIPTTLLAQDDAGIGVKNGINFFDQKNFMGVFVSPQKVIVDPYFLRTAGPKIVADGMAEIIKVMLMKDREGFEFIEKNYQVMLDLPKVLRGEKVVTPEEGERILKTAEEIIFLSIRNHLGQIKTDPHEKRLARPLDYGHQWGHRLEVVTEHRVSHGQGVAIGMAIDSYISWKRGRITQDEFERIIRAIRAVGLPIRHDEATLKNLWKGLEEFRQHLGGQLTVSLLGEDGALAGSEGIGKKGDVHDIQKAELKEALDYLDAVSGARLAEENRDPDTVIDLSGRKADLYALRVFRDSYLVKFEQKISEGHPAQEALWKVEGLFWEKGDRGKRLETLSYLIYGKTLSEPEFVRRLDQRKAEDLYVLKNLNSAISVVMKRAKRREGKFTFKKLLETYQAYLERHKNLGPGGLSSLDTDLLDRVLNFVEGRVSSNTKSLAEVRIAVTDAMDETKLGASGVTNLSAVAKGEKLTEALSKLKPHILVVRSSTKVDEALIDRLVPDLKVIIRGGHGLDNVDVDYARLMGVEVYGTQGSEKAVAAWALRAMAAAEQEGLRYKEDEAPAAFFTTHEWTQALEKKILKEKDEDQKTLLRKKADTLFAPVGADTIESLKGKTIGIIGFGAVGRELAAASKELGMRVLVNAPSLEKDPEPANSSGYQVASKEIIYKTSHYIVPVTGLYLTGPRQNAGMIGQAAVDLMLQNQNLIALVNPDREGLVDEMAITRLMEDGRVQYLVDEVPDSDYLKEHARYTPHIAASTEKAEGGVVLNTAALLARIYPETQERVTGARLAGPNQNSTQVVLTLQPNVRSIDERVHTDGGFRLLFKKSEILNTAFLDALEDFDKDIIKDPTQFFGKLKNPSQEHYDVAFVEWLRERSRTGSDIIGKKFKETGDWFQAGFPSFTKRTFEEVFREDSLAPFLYDESYEGASTSPKRYLSGYFLKKGLARDIGVLSKTSFSDLVPAILALEQSTNLAERRLYFKTGHHPALQTTILVDKLKKGSTFTSLLEDALRGARLAESADSDEFGIPDLGIVFESDTPFTSAERAKIKEATNLILRSGWLNDFPDAFASLPVWKWRRDLLVEAEPLKIATAYIAKAYFRSTDERLAAALFHEAHLRVEGHDIPSLLYPLSDNDRVSPAQLLQFSGSTVVITSFFLKMLKDGLLEPLEVSSLMRDVELVDQAIGRLKKDDARGVMSSDAKFWLWEIEQLWSKVKSTLPDKGIDTGSTEVKYLMGTREFKLLLAAYLLNQSLFLVPTVIQILRSNGPLLERQNERLLSSILFRTKITGDKELVQVVNEAAPSIPAIKLDAVVWLARVFWKGEKYKEARENILSRKNSGARLAELPRVILVEDNENFRKAYGKLLLKKFGDSIEIVLALSVKEAKEAKGDLVIVGNVEGVREARSLGVPVIFLSGSAKADPHATPHNRPDAFVSKLGKNVENSLAEAVSQILLIPVQNKKPGPNFVTMTKESAEQKSIQYGTAVYVVNQEGTLEDFLLAVEKLEGVPVQYVSLSPEKYDPSQVVSGSALKIEKNLQRKLFKGQKVAVIFKAIPSSQAAPTPVVKKSTPAPAVEKWIKDLASPDENVWKPAALALEKMGMEAPSALLRTMRAMDEDTKKRAFFVLEKIGSASISGKASDALTDTIPLLADATTGTNYSLFLSLSRIGADQNYSVELRLAVDASTSKMDTAPVSALDLEMSAPVKTPSTVIPVDRIQEPKGAQSVLNLLVFEARRRLQRGDWKDPVSGYEKYVQWANQYLKTSGAPASPAGARPRRSASHNEAAGTRLAERDLAPYKIRLEDRGDGSWISVRQEKDGSETRFEFQAHKLSDATSEDLKEKVASVYLELADRLDPADAKLKLLYTDPRRANDTIFLTSQNRVAALYNLSVKDGYVIGFVVDPAFRGTGAGDILLEEMVQRHLGGDRRNQIKGVVSRDSDRASVGRFRGTVDLFKSRLGMRSEVTVVREYAAKPTTGATATRSTAGARLSEKKDSVRFLVNVHHKQKQTGEIVLGKQRLRIAIRPKDRALMIYGLGDRPVAIKNYRLIRKGSTQNKSVPLDVSISELRQALGQDTQAVDAALGPIDTRVPVVAAIDLAAFSTPDSKETVFPLLVRELYAVRRQNAVFILKGPADQVDAVLKEAVELYGERQNFIYHDKDALPENFKNARRVVIMAPSEIIRSGVDQERTFLVKNLERGEIPNLKAILKTAIFEARIEKLESTDPQFARLLNAYRILLGNREITDISEFITVLDGSVRDLSILQKYMIAPKPIAYDAVLRVYALMIKMAEQSA